MVRMNMCGIACPFPRAPNTGSSSSILMRTSSASPRETAISSSRETSGPLPTPECCGRPSGISEIISTPIDLDPGEGFAIRTEPHPRFYTDRTDTVPIAVPALLRNWWPMMFFIVFKSPAEGRTHIFRPGEPFAQIIVLPAEAEFTLAEMDEEEAAERELKARRIHEARQTLSADTHWTSASNTVFDGTYRHILRAAKAKKTTG
jgi:hypothetical protein